MSKSRNASMSVSSPFKRFLAALLAALPVAAFGQVVIGNGRVETERRDVGAFSSLSLSGSGDLRVRKGPRKVTVTADSNILPYVITEVSRGRLEIGLKPMTGFLRVSKLIVEVSMPDLEGISLSGSGDAEVEKFEGGSLSASISGSGNLRAELDYREVELTISGSGRAELEGKAGSAKARISGSGDLRARDFAAKDAEIRISGSGNAELRVERRLEVEIGGSGNVRYAGSPEVSQRVRGSGSVKKIGD